MLNRRSFFKRLAVIPLVDGLIGGGGRPKCTGCGRVIVMKKDPDNKRQFVCVYCGNALFSKKKKKKV